MPKLSMNISHSLSQDEAIKRIKNLLNDVKTQYADKIGDLHEEWNGSTEKFNFSAMGFPLSGTLIVNTSHVEIPGNLPFTAIFFKKKIESTIKDRAEKLLA